MCIQNNPSQTWLKKQTTNVTGCVVHIPRSTTHIKKERNHAYNRLPSPESTPSSQAAHQEAPALTTTGLQKPFTLSLYRDPFSRLGEIDISSKLQAQTKLNKIERKKNVPQMKEYEEAPEERETF